MRVTLVAALARNRVIGRDGGIPWHLPDDLRGFKALTLGHCLVMGRRTHESIGRPLPGRTSIVLTRRAGWQEEGVLRAASLDEALARARGRGESECFVIGGAEVYAAALPLADRMVLTRVEAEVEGDTTFPSFDPGPWHCLSREPHPVDERHAFAFTREDWVRKGAPEGGDPPGR